MPINLGALQPSSQQPRTIDPIAIFGECARLDQTIQDLWIGQGKTLEEWHENRNKRDITISLNTGAGKTLVGLLMAQSLVNEEQAKILYVCSSKQLVEQTMEKAEGYGLKATSYMSGAYSNNFFEEAKGPCITTYQALFNGKSIFRNQEIAGVIFDDAHTAESIIRGQFSLTVKWSDFSELYQRLAGRFKDYFYQIGKKATFDGILETRVDDLLVIPSFLVKRNLAQILADFAEFEITENPETLFAWEHLKDKLDLCCFILTQGNITITPPFLPTKTLSYFEAGTRRIYLSATLEGADAFIRAFGKEAELSIAPHSTAGATERLILIPSLSNAVSNDGEFAESLIENRKTLIITPTRRRAESKWPDATLPETSAAVSTELESFKADMGTPHLALAARYDGVDLPGDTCRVMVIDDLPSSVSPLEKFQWNYLRMNNTLRSTVASRIVQCFGRISRGNSDHAIVILTGSRLVSWLLQPRNKERLPIFLQKQIDLGGQISASETLTDFSDFIQKVLSRNSEWVTTHRRFVSSDGPSTTGLSLDLEKQLAKAEAKYASAMWRRDFSGAAGALAGVLSDAHQLSDSTAAWYQYWIATAMDLSGELEESESYFRQAHANQVNLPIYDLRISENDSVSEQILNVVSQFSTATAQSVRLPNRFTEKLSPLSSLGTFAQVEEALRCLGAFLGFESSRPDKEEDTGPDNLWVIDQVAFCIDAKTNKEPGSTYKKDDFGQMADHVQWVKNHRSVNKVIPIFVGPDLDASNSANPSRKNRLITMESISEFVDELENIFHDLASSSSSSTLHENVVQQFSVNKLLYGDLLKTLRAKRFTE